MEVLPSGPDIRSGAARSAGVYRSANDLASGFSASRWDEAAAVRDLAWSAPCGCFVYPDATNWAS
jgi:hypothetical protein